MSICDEIQELMAEAGVEAALADADMARHLADCAECQAVRAALDELDDSLAAPAGFDAPDQLVEATLARVRDEASGGGGEWRSGPARRRLAGALAASIVLVACFTLSRSVLDLVGNQWSYQMSSPADFFSAVEGKLAANYAGGPMAEPEGEIASSNAAPAPAKQQAQGEARLYSRAAPVEAGTDSDDVTHRREAGRQTRNLAKSVEEAAPTTRGNRPAGSLRWDDAPARDREAELLARLRRPPASAPPESNLADHADARLGKAKNKASENDRRRVELKRGLSRGQFSASERNFAAAGGTLGRHGKIANSLDKLAEDGRGDRVASKSEGVETEVPADDNELRGPAFRDEEAQSSDRDRRDRFAYKADGKTRSSEASSVATPKPAAKIVGGKRSRPSALPAPVGADPARDAARSFLADISRLDDLAFQPASGYWRNTYVPGDPDMRLLGARLATWDRRALGARAGLERGVRPILQLLDPPRGAALALELHADTGAVTGPTRLRLQVGLQGAARQGGHRPAMSVALVLDLRQHLDAGSARQFRALASALERARQPGDRFSLVVAGPAGGVAVRPESFRHGPLKVALAGLLGEPRSEEAGAISLIEAVKLAGEALRAEATGAAVLGANVVLLATARPLGVEWEPLETLAHANALGGILTSVVAVGDAVALARLDRLVAAGQGNRRLLRRAEEAEALIARELHAASRVVARAVRLRIRLAPGVELIDVLGSRRLDEVRATRVREAESSIDRRLARDLGIAADRGEDEEGIQIVIPNFQAGDAHVILLDVVVPGPGQVADVTARYKDVVQLRNGVAHAHLSLPKGERAMGVAERNVLKNLLAFEMARRARGLSGLLAAERDGEAAALAGEFAGLLAGLRREVPGWADDPELAADGAFLAEYRALIASRALADPTTRRMIADSLRYAAFAKLHDKFAQATPEETPR